MNDVDRLLKEGIAAVKSGQRTKARALLQEVVRQRPNDATAWLWLSGAVETDDERRQCLERILAFDPNNAHAIRGLQKLRPSTTPIQGAFEPTRVGTEESLFPQSERERCPHCGAVTQAKSRFCAVCGRELDTPVIAPSLSTRPRRPSPIVAKKSTRSTKGKRRKKSRRLTLWGVSGLVVILLCCSALLCNNLTSDTGTSRTDTGGVEERRITVPSGKLSELSEYPTNKEVFVQKKDGTIDPRPGDLEELCKDWLYYRKKILEYEAAGKTQQAAEARTSFQSVNAWLDEYDESDVSTMFDILERRGYRPP